MTRMIEVSQIDSVPFLVVIKYLPERAARLSIITFMVQRFWAGHGKLSQIIAILTSTRRQCNKLSFK